VASAVVPQDINFGFLDGSRYFSFQSLINYGHEDEETPFQTITSKKIWQTVVSATSRVLTSAARNQNGDAQLDAQ
jgi:hypothetical protein